MAELVKPANVPQCPYCRRDLELVIENRSNSGKVGIALVCPKHGTVNERWKNELIADLAQKGVK